MATYTKYIYIYILLSVYWTKSIGMNCKKRSELVGPKNALNAIYLNDARKYTHITLKTTHCTHWLSQNETSRANKFAKCTKPSTKDQLCMQSETIQFASKFTACFEKYICSLIISSILYIYFFRFKYLVFSFLLSSSLRAFNDFYVHVSVSMIDVLFWKVPWGDSNKKSKLYDT